MSFVRIRYQAFWTQDGSHLGRVQSVVDFLQDRWGEGFVHSLNERHLDKQFELMAPRNPRKFSGSNIPIWIDLRPIGDSTPFDCLQALSVEECCLSIADIATQFLLDSKISVPKKLVLVCGGSGLPALPGSMGELLVSGCVQMLPVLTISKSDGAIRLDLSAVEAGSKVPDGVVPVAYFRK